MSSWRTTDPTQFNFKDRFDLVGRVVVVTGACGLIGRAICEAICQMEGIVVVADVPEANPEKFAEELFERHGRIMLGVGLDVSKREEVQRLFDTIMETYGRFEGLVCAHQNKSNLKFVPFEKVTDENWDKVIEVNLKGTFLLCQILGSYMAEFPKYGSIITFPSTYSVVAPNQNLYEGTSLGCPAEYSASKGGIDALSRYLASYWGTKGVRVNMITPHGVWNNHEPKFESNFARFTPMRRMSYNHEVANAAVFLLSDSASYVTGHNLMVDGGWTVW
ncbi:MAG: hypothetical protein RL220_1733 [Bacteroidota bacterium]